MSFSSCVGVDVTGEGSGVTVRTATGYRGISPNAGLGGMMVVEVAVAVEV